VSSDNALSSNAEDDAQAETVTDEDPRNKRFLFNLRGGAGGGSGNFLFDLIRVSVIINIYTWFLFHMTCTLPTFLSFSISSRNRKNTTNCYIIIAPHIIRPETKKYLLPIFMYNITLCTHTYYLRPELIKANNYCAWSVFVHDLAVVYFKYDEIASKYIILILFLVYNIP